MKISKVRLLSIVSEEILTIIKEMDLIEFSKSQNFSCMEELDKISRNNILFDLIIVEDTIIGRDFEILLEEMSKRKNLLSLPLVLVSEYPYSDNILHMIDNNHIYAVLRKPFDSSEFKLILKNLEKFDGFLPFYPDISGALVDFFKKYCHDVNNLAGKIMMGASFLEDDSYGEEVVEIAESISEVVSELSSFVRRSSEIFTTLSFVEEEVNFKEIVEEAIVNLKKDYLDVELKTNLSCDDCTFIGSKYELLILVQELLKNAFEGRIGNEVSLFLLKNDDKISFFIKNRGEPISSDNINKLPIYGITTKSKENHKGIGLAVVRGICQRNKINIRFKRDANFNMIELEI